MAQQIATSVENSFIKGLQTESTGLNFPENSCIETFNCVFNLSGSVERRPGFMAESNSEPYTDDREGNAIATYLWKDAGGTGSIAVVVQQIGTTLRFFDTSNSLSISGGLSTDTVDLTDYLPSGGDDSTVTINECQFSSGNGYLFVTHPFLEPFYVTYLNGEFTATQIDVKVRDLFGEPTDANATTTRPSSLVDAHKYNLLNQGWTSDLITAFQSGTVPAQTTWSSASANGTAMSEAVVASLLPGMVIASGGPTGWASSNIVSVNPVPPASATGTDNVSSITMSSNAGASTSGIINFKMNVYPSNADIWWSMKNEYDVFSPSAIASAANTNSPAPKGHFISSAWKIDRSTLSGLSGLTTTSCGLRRPSTTAFYAGRVWYAGIDATGYNNVLYFSQIMDDVNKAGLCYQREDPTDEDLSDLLPSDGGTISINGCGTIYKIIASAASLIVFAANGVWEVTGNQGLSLTATDYSVNKLSNVPSLSHRSFVEIDGNILWWNANGIYAMSHTQTGTQVQSLSDSTISTFLAAIPQNNKVFVRGAFNSYSRIVQWLYRIADTTAFADNYQYDGILNFNMNSGAFYPWTFNNTSTGINDIISLDSSFGAAVTYDVQDSSDVLVTAGGDQVTITANAGNIGTPEFRYSLSAPNDDDYDFTFGSCSNDTYIDWPADQNVDAAAEFVSGYRLRGGALKKFQPNYVNVYANVPTNVYFQGIWDYAVNTDSNRFSTRQIVSSEDTNYLVFKKRLKVRGRGVVLVFRVQSRPGEPFNIIGWAVEDIGNARP